MLKKGASLLMGEMSYRLKNVLATTAGLTAITSHSTTTVNDMPRELTQNSDMGILLSTSAKPR